MTYTFVYEPDYERIMTACIIDARASIPAIKNQIGNVIKSYCDNQVATITDESIVYKIETELGVLAGFFAIRVNTTNQTATMIVTQLRPAFMQFTSDLSTQITTFIQNNSWKPDYLF